MYDVFSSNAYPVPSFSLHQSCVFLLDWFSASFPFLALCLFLTCSRFHIFSIHVACGHFFLFVVLTYTRCASQAPERSCRILACLSAQQYGGACFVFRLFLSRCTHIRKAFTKLEFPPKCCSSVFKRRDRGDGMCRTAKMGGEEDERTVFSLLSCHIFPSLYVLLLSLPTRG